jgi:TolB-like protein
MIDDPVQRKNKVRAAWISFVGRIVAQVIGAIASVTIGLMVLTKYGFPERGSVEPAAASVAPPVAHATPPKPSRPVGEVTLAVLPVQNYSKDATHVYFVDGLTEGLIAELAQVAGLKVTSRTSSMAYKGTTKSLPAIARELDVDLILESSVVRDGTLVRVTAQLIDGGSDRHLWARTYDRPRRDLLPLQAELTTTIAGDVNLAVRRWVGALTSPRPLVNARVDR